jgi:hypothetical protein
MLIRVGLVCVGAFIEVSVHTLKIRRNIRQSRAFTALVFKDAHKGRVGLCACVRRGECAFVVSVCVVLYNSQKKMS